MTETTMDLILIDEAGAPPVTAGRARFARPVATVREIIRARAELHWEAARDAVFLASVETAERGFGSMFRETGRCDDVVAAAEAGFVTGRYYLLLDDRQAVDLDEQIDLARTGSATFLLITPLKGG